MDMVRQKMVVLLALLVTIPSNLTPTTAELSRNYYANICPDVESIVRNVVAMKLRQTNDTVPATIRLFFHDCIVQGCDASVIIRSTPTNKAEKDHPDNLSLAGDGFDTVIKAKAAVDAVPQCRNKVSCADILAIATRDVIELAGGPSYAVELGRLDGLSSMASSVTGTLPSPDSNLDELTSLFASRGLTMVDMIALSAAHTVGFSHCKRFASRIYNYSASTPVDPLLNPKYAKELMAACPRVVDPRVSIHLDPVTPETFDNQYFKNLQQGKGLLTSDQVLFTDPRSHTHVDLWAQDSTAFSRAFVEAITKLGRVGVKGGSQGNVRRDCAVFN